jgi:sulfur carrier protein
MTIELSLNGERINADTSTLQALLLAQGYKLETAFACAINNSFVPRHQWSEHVLVGGDRIDIVTPITGG